MGCCVTLTEFDPKAYWRERVGEDADLGIVGHRSLGARYNAYIYRRRIEALTELLQGQGLDLHGVRILDVGCGSGFYTAFWESCKVRSYVGMDISPESTGRLTRLYPEYRFVNADIASPLTSWPVTDLGLFDIITVFDVFYHITDDADFARSVANLGRLLREDGRVIIFDHLLEREYMLTAHVKFRARRDYLQCLRSAGLEIVEQRKLFQLLVPPVTGKRLLDLPIAGIYKLFGFFMMRSDALATFAGRRLLALDRRLLARGHDMANHEMFMVKRAAGQ